MTAIILDDEPFSADALYITLKKYCPEIKILAKENDAPSAINKINEYNPDLLFLDIELLGTNAFEVIEKLAISCAIIFTTAYEKYALKAIKLEVIDYLLKPIDPTELVKAVEKAKRIINVKPERNIPSQTESVNIITIPTHQGLSFVELDHIVHIEANKNVTILYKTDDSLIISNRNIGSIEKMLQFSAFIKVHKSHIINLKYLDKYNKDDGGEILLKNGKKIPLARDRRTSFISAVKQ
jgi:two-component system, LytTR family, response regulator